MTKNVASYLTLRGSIYYFQMRVNKGVVSEKYKHSRLIRKSTGTGNRVEALKIAREWWVNIMVKQTDIDGAEEQMNRLDQLYRRGKVLSQKLSELDDGDGIEIEEFLSDNLGTSGFSQKFDIEALDYYQSQSKDNVVADNSAVDKNVLDVIRGEMRQVKVVNKRFSELLDLYLEEQRSSAKPLGVKAHKKYQLLISVMIEMIGDMYAHKLTVEHFVSSYANELHKIPLQRNNSKIYQDKNGNILNMTECIRIAEENNCKRISKSSVSDYAGRVRGFLNWCTKRKYIADDILSALDKFKKVSSRDKEQNRAFTKSELEKLFLSDDFVKGLWLHNKSFRHWGCLLALYTGARAGEIAQIHLDDIKYEDSLKAWFIELIDEGENRSLKTKDRRVIPIHNDLISLGFVRYVEHLRSRKQKQLFDEFKADKNSYWHRKLTRWFNGTYIKECGITKERGERKSFHSFRKTFINQGKQLRLDSEVLDEIVGHSNKTKVQDTYREEFILKTKHCEINKLHYDIDISQIKKWQ